MVYGMYYPPKNTYYSATHMVRVRSSKRKLFRPQGSLKFSSFTGENFNSSLKYMTIHFRVLGTSPVSGPGRGPPSCNRRKGFFPPWEPRFGIHLSRDRLPWNCWSFLNYKCLAARGKTLHLCFTCFSSWAFARRYWMGFRPSDLQESALLKLGVNVWILPQRHSSQYTVSWSSLSPSPKIKLLFSVPFPSP